MLRATPLVTEADARAFVGRVGDVETDEVARLLPTVVDFGGTADTKRLGAAVFVTLAKRAPGPALFAPGVRALKTAEGVLRDALIELLPTWNDVAAHGELVDLLGAERAEARAAAVEVLKQVGGRTALELAEKRAHKANFLGRIDAINAFVGRAGHHTLGLLGSVVAAGRPLEKIHALRMLADAARFKNHEADVIEIALPATDDKDDLVVAQAITTVGMFGDAELVADLEACVEGRGPEVLKAFVRVAAATTNEGLAAFVRARFRDGPKAVRLMILESIEANGSEALFGTVVEALSNKDLAIRARAAHAVTELSNSGRVDAARAIVWLLRGKDVNVRRLAAEIATQVEDADGSLAPRLLGFLKDEDWWVRERVLDALVELDAPGITKHVIRDYLSDESGTVRRFAVNALMRIGDPRSLGALVRTAQDDADWLVRDLAVEAIGALGDERAAVYLVDLTEREPELRVGCLHALRRLRAADACEEVAHLVEDEDADVRLATLELLDALDDGSFALWAKACENDESKPVREVAGRLLRRYKLDERVEEGATHLKNLDVILAHMLQRGADDLFLFAGRRPYVKKDGKVEPLGESVLAGPRIRELLEAHLTPTQRDALAARKDVDFSYELAARAARFRVNVFHQVSGIAAVFRVVKNEIVTLEELGVPPIVASFAKLANGLVLVGGPTGAGKSTTLAALIDHINRSAPRHIVTLEDPIERVHAPKESVVNQRELGPHTRTFSSALRSTMRQDPDVILVGELRDLDTIAFAISAAETGHLVLGSVHTTSADATVDRLISSFPARQQAQIRGMLADSLRAVTNQFLLRTPDGGRRPAVEVMLNTEPIQALIRKGKTFQIPTVIATSRDLGMQSMDSELLRLAKEGLVVVDDAYAKTVDKRAFEAALGLPSPDGILGGASTRGLATPARGALEGPSPPGGDRRGLETPPRGLRTLEPRDVPGRGDRGNT